jgi:hypothetical protein
MSEGILKRTCPLRALVELTEYTYAVHFRQTQAKRYSAYIDLSFFKPLTNNSISSSFRNWAEYEEMDVVESPDTEWVEVHLHELSSRNEFSLKFVQLLADSKYYFVPDFGDSEAGVTFPTLSSLYWARAWRTFRPPSSVVGGIAAQMLPLSPDQWEGVITDSIVDLHPDFRASLERLQFLISRLQAFLSTHN